MITNYKIFESKFLKTDDGYTDLDEIKNYIDIFLDSDIVRSGSFRSSHYYREDYKSDIEKLRKNLFEKLKVDLDEVMTYYRSDIYSDNFFINSCGFLDTLLYVYDNKYILSGDVLDDTIGVSDDDEYLIKYQYGYETFDLGKKYLSQNYNEIKDIYYDCANNFWLYQNSKMFNMDDYEKNIDLFSLADERKNGSVAVLWVEKLFEIYQEEQKTFYFRSLEGLVDHIKYELNEKKEKDKKRRRIIKELNYRHFKWKNELNLFIVGFGDINLNEIYDSDLFEYVEKIEEYNVTNKYNL